MEKEHTDCHQPPPSPHTGTHIDTHKLTHTHTQTKEVVYWAGIITTHCSMIQITFTQLSALRDTKKCDTVTECIPPWAQRVPTDAGRHMTNTSPLTTTTETKTKIIPPFEAFYSRVWEMNQAGSDGKISARLLREYQWLNKSYFLKVYTRKLSFKP